MDCQITLPFWPSNTRNVSWSSENLIAVGGGENLAILVPRFNTKDLDDSQWEQVIIQANTFNTHEVPIHDPLSWCNYSAGEELSLRHVDRLNWSYGGLAKFGTCALAVLHSNHVLCLWESEGKPEAKDKWQRCLIVNHAIRTYYDRKDPIGDDAAADKVELQQVRQRVRAFAWLQPVRKSYASSRILQASVDRGMHYIAVSTEGKDVLIVRIHSPYDFSNASTAKWTAEVVHCIDTSNLTVNSSQQQPSDTQAPGTIDDGQSGSRIVDELACARWDPSGRAYLACIMDGRLFVHHIQSENLLPGTVEKRRAEPCINLLPAMSDLTGPVQFDNESGRIIAFATDQVFSVGISDTVQDLPPTQSHHLDGRWDEVSDLALTYAEGDRPEFHITSLISTLSTPTKTLSGDLQPSDTKSTWPRLIMKAKKAYSTEFDLDDNVQVKTWGIASSPLGDFVTTSSQMLPSDAPAHIISSEQISTICISREWHPSSTSLLPGCRNLQSPEIISAETLLWSLQSRPVETEIAPSVDEAARVHSISEAMGVTRPGSILHETNSPNSWDDTNEVLAWLRASIYFRNEHLGARLSRLGRLTQGLSSGKILTVGEYLNTAGVIESFPQVLVACDSISQKINDAFATAKMKMAAEPDPSTDPVEPWHEDCSICHQQIAFESLRWSRCSSGHQFERCSLTLLTILRPGISKSCRICNAQYLNEACLEDLERTDPSNITMEDVTNDGTLDATDRWVHVTLQQQRNGSGLPLSLARLLFSACDRCLVCGGHFQV